MIYRGMDQAQLDAAYNNTRAVADFATIVESFQARSSSFYEKSGWQRDLRYGVHPRERFDLLPSGLQDAPTLIYLHGGYWQTMGKEVFSFVGEGAHKSGCNFVLAEYTLAPEFSMTQIVEQIRRMLDHLAAERENLGLADGHVCLAGHSAGGHLSLIHRSHPLLNHVMAISALVDLEPISLSWLNEKLQLTPAEIVAYSPLHHIHAGVPATVVVGAAELPELVRHSEEFARKAIDAGEPVTYNALENLNHFTVLNELADPSGFLVKTLMQSLSRA
jgi:acetyl esterase/lipase